MNINEIAQFIDHTNLKPESTITAIQQLCDEAKKYNFATVCIHPVYVRRACKMLAESSVSVCTVIGFPLGANVTDIKVKEAVQAIDDGATEIDMVIQIGALKAGEIEIVGNDILRVVEVCHQKNALCKVIIETALLTQEEKIIACELVRKAGADFIKTSTGFGPGGATVDDVKLLAQQMQGTSIKVKAAGGIRSREDFDKMVIAGASRIGTSSGVKIMEGTK
ncbi:deoxyribose-phosphate aldolase [candidate division KSB1 bacterium]|nr:deoxyribose-phosphate aldolase [candidate division KSB1 bacterium]